MEKLDMKKSLKQCYSAKKKVQFADIPAINYISYRGKGDPNTSEEFQKAMPVLYGLAYTIKFICKAEEKDFTVMPLEAQWWTDPPEAFSEEHKEDWLWKAMIAVPDYITRDRFEEAVLQLKKKKNPEGLEKAFFETHQEGLSAQFLYIGPYSGESAYIDEMHRYIKENGYKLRGKHREIYLSNPQRVSEDKLKTIIRHPIEPA